MLHDFEKYRFYDFFSRLKDNSLYCYGIGEYFERMLSNFPDYPWERKLKGLINTASRHGQFHSVRQSKFQIGSVNDLLRDMTEDSTILITCTAYSEIVDQLNQIQELDHTECYIYCFMCNFPIGKSIDLKMNEGFKIPPTIHYCWFGGKAFPELYRRCMDSWREYCPDYQIVEWNESNCDIESNQYCKQAYEKRKYGFVSDYFRLKVVYENGGIYLGTDVELIKSLDDLRREEAFCGLQEPGKANFGLGFGAMQGNGIIKEIMDIYEELEFVRPDGSLNEVPCPVYQTEVLIKNGMGYGNKQMYIPGMCIYPTEVLSPINPRTRTGIVITENTYAIHHYAGSWASRDRKEKANNALKSARQIEALFI